MTIQTRPYAYGTSLTVSYPWGINVKGRARCSDGVTRTLSRIAQTADTFFSIPAAVKVRGKTVTGYVTFSETDDGSQYVKFVHYRYGKNAGMLPNALSDISVTPSHSPVTEA